MLRDEALGADGRLGGGEAEQEHPEGVLLLGQERGDRVGLVGDGSDVEGHDRILSVGATSVEEKQDRTCPLPVADSPHGRDHRARAEPARAAPAAARVDRPRARRAARRHHPQRAPRRGAPAGTRLPGPGHPGRRRGLPAGTRPRAPAAPARRRGGGRRRGVPADGRRRHRVRSQRGCAANPRQARPGDAAPAARRGAGHPRGDADARPGSGHRRRRRTAAAGAGVPRPGPGAVRLRGPRRYAELPHRRAGRAGRHRPAVVPDGLRRRPRGLAHVPAGPAAGGRADHVALPRA